MENSNETSPTALEAKEKKQGKSKLKINGKKIKKFFQNWDKRIIFIIVCILVVAFCFFGIIGLGSYRFGWDNKFVNGIIKSLPYPAAIVDGKIIKYYDFREEAKAVILLNEKRGLGASMGAIEKEVLEKLIYDQLLKTMARKFDISVSQEDIDIRINIFIEQLGSREELVKNINEFFGWDLETFNKRIIYTDILKEKLEKEIPDSEKSLAEAEKKAREVLKKIKGGEKSFEELAQEYSDDTASGKNGGDLGWFPRGVMVKEFEDAAFATEPGQVSGLVKTSFGYHIIKIEDKKTEEQNGEAVEQVKARHILIASQTFNDYLEEYRNKVKVYKFVALD